MSHLQVVEEDEVYSHFNLGAQRLKVSLQITFKN